MMSWSTGISTPKEAAVVDLSSAAESVWEAFDADHGNRLAAALRAAALYCPQDRGVLMMIAAELEAHGPL